MPRLVCVEMHPAVAGQITAYFDKNGYVRLGSYMNVDSLNGYFTPADGPDARREADRMRSLKKEFEQESAVSAGSAN